MSITRFYTWIDCLLFFLMLRKYIIERSTYTDVTLLVNICFFYFNAMRFNIQIMLCDVAYRVLSLSFVANIERSELAKVCTIVNTYTHFRATDSEFIDEMFWLYTWQAIRRVETFFNNMFFLFFFCLFQDTVLASNVLLFFLINDHRPEFYIRLKTDFA